MNALALVTPAPVTRVERNPAKVYLASLSRGGRRGMAQKLTTVARILGYSDPRLVDWSQLRFEHMVAIKTKLIEIGLAPATVNCTLAAVRGVAKSAWAMDLISGDVLARIASVKGLRSSRLPAGRALSSGEINALFADCYKDESPAGRRDAAILVLLLGAGLRRAEGAELAFADYNAEDRTLRVHGKGDKQRLMPLPESANQAVQDWLTVRGDWAGPLLCRVRKDGVIGQQGVTSQAIYKALNKRGSAGKVAAFSPHDLRRTYASQLIDSSGDISSVSKLMGHASITTTQIYDRRGEAAKRKVADSLHLPYRRHTQPKGVQA